VVICPIRSCLRSKKPVAAANLSFGAERATAGHGKPLSWPPSNQFNHLIIGAHGSSSMGDGKHRNVAGNAETLISSCIDTSLG
jgi:hypothetical protein